MSKPERALCAVLAAVLVCALVPAGALQPRTAEAASYDVGFSGKKLVLDDYDLDVSDDATPEAYVGGTGAIKYVGAYDDADEDGGYEVRFESSDESVLAVSGSTYTVTGQGVVTVSAVLYNTATQQESDSDDEAYVYATWVSEELGSYTFVCGKSTAKAKLKKTTYKAYVAGSYGYEASVDITFKNLPKLAYYSLDCTCSGSSLYLCDVTYKPAKKKVRLSIWGTGSSTVKITLNDTTFKFKLKVKTLTLNDGQALMVMGKSKKLKLSSSVGNAKWSSSKKKVASVSKKGKVKAKKVGTTIVYAKVGSAKVGCAVSVVTAKRYKVIKRAQSIAKGTYSQAKRMQDGYYDCSSLVCRSYWLEGIYFGGSSSWAPVAASVGKWCVSHGKKIKGGCSNGNVAKLRLRAGDLAFQTGSDNGRYKGIYHVEMMTGYRWVGTYSNGKPYLLLTWASRSDGYSQGSGTLMARP